jgi:hypothetical protein
MLLMILFYYSFVFFDGRGVHFSCGWGVFFTGGVSFLAKEIFFFTQYLSFLDLMLFFFGLGSLDRGPLVYEWELRVSRGG